MSTQDSPFDPNEMSELYPLHISDYDHIRVHKQNANNVFLLNNSGGGEGGNVALKTINGVTLKGTGNIELPTTSEVTSLSEKQQTDHNTVVQMLTTERQAREVADVDTNARVSALETQNFKTINNESIKGTGDISLVMQEDYELDKQVTEASITQITNTQGEHATDIENLDQRVQFLENKETEELELKTLNGESLKGTGNIEVPTKQYVDDSVNALVQSVNAVTQAVTTEQSERVQADSAMENTISALDVRVKAIEDAPVTPIDVELKTINGESVEGVGDIVVATPSQVNDAKAEVVLKIDTELAAETQARETADAGLAARVQALESATPTPLAFKTVNGEQILGQGDIEVATKVEMTEATDRITVLEQHDATHDNQIVALQDAVARKLEDAPSDSKQYARSNGDWVEVEATGSGELKTINGESLKGGGNILLPTASDIADAVAVVESEVLLLKDQISTEELVREQADLDLNTRMEALENASSLQLKTINGETLQGEGDLSLVKVEDLADVQVLLTDYTDSQVNTEKSSREAFDLALSNRISNLEGSAITQFKTVNGEEIVGIGNITTPTRAEVDAKADKIHTHVATEVDETANRVWFSPSERAQITSNTNEIQSHSQRIADLENAEQGVTTDEKVKMDVDDVAGYLADKVDGSTISAVGGKLSVISLTGVTVGADEINSLAGVTGNIQAQINSLSTVGKLKEAVASHADLLNISDMSDSDMVIVLSDETQGGISTINIYNGTSWVFGGEFRGGEIRDFVLNPLSLSSEVAGTLPRTKVEVQPASLTPIADTSGVFNSNNVEDALLELFTYANNIKSSYARIIGNPLTASDSVADALAKLETLKINLASAIVDKGVPANSSNTVAELVDKVAAIPNVEMVGNLKSTEVVSLAANGTITTRLNAGVAVDDLCATLLRYTDGASNVTLYTKSFSNFDGYRQEGIFESYGSVAKIKVPLVLNTTLVSEGKYSSSVNVPITSITF